MKDLQKCLEGWGLGISVEKLVDKVYWIMAAHGHDVCMLNERYLIVDGQAYRFIKSRKNNCWIAKPF